MSTYVPPPPPAAPKSNAWAKWILGGCGGCLIVVIIISYGMFKMFGAAIGDSVTLHLQMQQTLKDINRYKQDTGKYPDKLEDLVPKYVASEQDLKLSSKPEGPKFTYFKPGKDSKSDDVILQYDLVVKAGDQTVTVPIQFLIDGRNRQGQEVVTPSNQPIPSSGSSPPSPSKSKSN